MGTRSQPRERFYQMPAAERDKLILELRAQGWTMRAIAKRVGMHHSGVERSLERMGRGGVGRDRRA